MPRTVSKYNAKSIIRGAARKYLTARQQLREGTIANRRASTGPARASASMSNLFLYRGVFAFPQQLKTRMRSSFTGFWPAAQAGTNNINFSVYGNSAQGPFNSANTITASGLSATGGSVYTQNFPGFSLLSQAYNAYKVYASSIKVTIIPSSAGDVCTVTTWPIDYDGYQALTIGIGGTAHAISGTSGSRQRVISLNSGSMVDNTVYNYAKSAAALGMTPIRYAAQQAILDGQQPPGIGAWLWGINIMTNSGGVLNSVLYCTVELMIDVEFSQTQQLAT